MGSAISNSAPDAAGKASNRPRAWPRQKYLLFGFIGVMYAYVLWKNERFLIDPQDPYWAHIQQFQWWLLPHGLAAACALFLGPLQFSDRLRRRYAILHRVIGRCYVAGVFLGAPLGVYIQFFEERMGTTRSFTVATVIDAVLWMLTTGVALAFIRQGKVQQHRQWMTRSFACAIIFLEVRVIIGLTGWEQHSETIVWTCVAMAIPLADLVLQWQDRPRARPVAGKAALSVEGASGV